ncbi:hypothetical protein [Streptomyces pseudovenezuelae]|uniref:hypothetical protein n=1 Tax=Streptomyces pseudovenezuelae TaxID=67350 RepID=UPI002E3783B0|nr:hypothetical protein [Streptomyces pseudovenezuelae]
MGVFARLLRRSKATEEASTAETQADIPTAESAAEEAAQAKGSTDVEGGAGTGTEVDSPAVAEAADSDTATTKGTDGSTATEDGEDAAAEGVEIPKQQSAAAAADHEAGEGART